MAKPNSYANPSADSSEHEPSQPKDSFAKKISQTAAAVKNSFKVGTISTVIGEGDNAKNSIVWVCMRWCLGFGMLLSLMLFLRSMYQCDIRDYEILDSIKSVWAIFMPVVTLALGYIFGKGK